jgi:hypothetical protein
MERDDAIKMWRDLWTRRRSWLDALSDGEKTSLASDLAVGVGELPGLMEQDSGRGVLFQRMLAAYGLSPNDLDPRERRAAEHRCTSCDQSDHCQAELNAGHAAERATTYCPNAPRLAAIASTRP